MLIALGLVKVKQFICSKFVQNNEMFQKSSKLLIWKFCPCFSAILS